MSNRFFVRLCLFIYGLIGLAFLLSASFQLQVEAASQKAPPEHNHHPFEVSQTLQIPDAPAKGWCYDVGWTAGGHYYLSDDSRRQIDVVTIRNNGKDILTHPIGHNDFMGTMGCMKGDYSQEGLEGIEKLNGQLWTSDGNSHILVFDAKSGQLLYTIDTKGKLRADEMTFMPTLGLLAVTNPDETFARPAGTPYLTFISTHSYRVVAKMPFPSAQSGQSGLQQPRWIGGNELLVDVPAPHGNNGGELDRVAVDSDSYSNYQTHVLQRYSLTACSPSGFAMDTSTGLAAVGCAGGRQIIWNVRTNQVMASLAIPGVDIIAVSNHSFFFPSYVKQTLTITDEQGRIVQTFKTSAQSHTVTADPVSRQVFVPLDGGKVMVLCPEYAQG